MKKCQTRNFRPIFQSYFEHSALCNSPRIVLTVFSNFGCLHPVKLKMHRYSLKLKVVKWINIVRKISDNFWGGWDFQSLGRLSFRTQCPRFWSSKTFPILIYVVFYCVSDERTILSRKWHSLRLALTWGKS